MATLVCFHAHPDDESIATGGTMAAAAAAGHRVVLVLATRGEHGEVDDGFLDEGETLSGRRERETLASADVLGVATVEFLGYTDSGMMGTPENDLPGSFWTADVDEAAQRLAEILRAEQAEMLTIYDSNGNYGHPDHIQVHRVGVRAAELAGTPRVYEATVNRDEMRRGMAELAEQGMLPGEAPDFEEFELGVSESVLTTRVDVSDWLQQKRASMRSHASQIAEQSFFLSMPDSAFTSAFGVEWYIHRGVATPVEEFETSLWG
ncbi:MAG: GlcNAc-PI de-N-acetylase [Acidimicrobiales bacterium]|nr:GlcNAc-PI de-N-acetylase [Acidimicrobiales bacterium]